MNPMSTLDESLSLALAHQINSQAGQPFENAHQAAVASEGAQYVQGFLVISGQPEPIEHAWIETGDRILDPTLPHLKQPADRLHYFAAHRLSLPQLVAAIEVATEDYPDDPPLPVYGDAPYAYYGNVMLGGQDYLDAYSAAQAQGQAAEGTDMNGGRASLN